MPWPPPTHMDSTPNSSVPPEHSRILQTPCSDRVFGWSGWGDLNSRPSVPQIDQPQTADLRKRPETCRDLQFWLITGSRRFAVFRDVSRPVRGLSKSGCVTPVATCVAAYLKITPAAIGSKPSGHMVCRSAVAPCRFAIGSHTSNPRRSTSSSSASPTSPWSKTGPLPRCVKQSNWPKQDTASRSSTRPTSCVSSTGRRPVADQGWFVSGTGSG